MKEEGLLSRRRFSTCGGTASLRPPHPDGRKLIRNASFGGYNELSPMSLPGGCMMVWRQPHWETGITSLKIPLYGEVILSERIKRVILFCLCSLATKELLSTITDPSVIVMADWLKIRGTLKSWTKLWCVLKPGVLLIYKTHKNGQWVGTVLLNACELIERPSKKDGFCFKLFHPLEQSIWAVKGPKGEAVGSITQPLPSSHLIFRAASESDGRCWMDALELALKCSSLLKRTMIREGKEDVSTAGEAAQTETVSEENKSLIWTLLKQVRPGMDLSKVVLPTFILEPRSFLDKLSDYYYHLHEAGVHSTAYATPYTKSHLCLNPQGLKKPYNPILGETYRCMWLHQKTNSKTFYIAEQVSHHPPVSAFYVSNRKDGFCLSGSILAKSKFYGNSLSAILDGEARLTFLNRGEDYVMNMPYAHCKGILYGTMTLELGGQITIACEKTGYSAQLEFKLKPFLGSSDSVNQISGKIKLGKEVLATLEGHWDSEIFINDKKTGTVDTFWNPTPDLRQSRLIRFTVPPEEQGEFESERLWQHVTRAINNKDQTEATNEKFILEEAQRKVTRERKAKCEEWLPALFEQDPVTGEWHYRYADTRPWDPLNDLIQFEKDGCIQTKVRHRTPMVRSGSLISLSNQGPRRDNCKCQVGRAVRKASCCLSHLPRSTWCTVFIVACSVVVVIALLPPPSAPLLLLFLFTSVFLFLLWHLLFSL
uniref:Oxysterol-binding protein n=1 Tax=Anabas testudineus TaxID=64144 RepID=A0A7N6AB35_ANATE